MDAVLLARAQFAANMSFHILFPTISIALGWMLLFFRWRWLRTKDDMKSKDQQVDGLRQQLAATEDAARVRECVFDLESEFVLVQMKDETIMALQRQLKQRETEVCTACREFTQPFCSCRMRNPRTLISRLSSR